MRRYAFIAAIFGLAVLLVIFIEAKPVEVNNFDELNALDLNTKILISGKVESERDLGDFLIMNLKGVELVCNCAGNYLEKFVEVEGVVEEYNGRKQIGVLKINILH